MHLIFLNVVLATFSWGVPVTKLSHHLTGILAAVDDNYVYMQKNEYVEAYVKGTISTTFNIAPQKPQLSSKFGEQVSSNSRYLVVGALGYNGRKGAAFIFRINSTTHSFTELQMLFDEEGKAMDNFGYRVSISPENVVVIVGGTQKAHLFEYSDKVEQWIKTKIIDKVSPLAPIAQNIQQLAMVKSGATRRKLQIYRNIGNGTWDHAQEISDFISIEDMRFEDGRLIIGDPRNVYIYSSTETNRWILNQTVTRPDDSFSCCGVKDGFGQSVYLKYGVLVVGAPMHSSDGKFIKESGRAYVFIYDKQSGSWMEKLILEQRSPRTRNWFGHAVAVDEYFIFIGSKNVDVRTVSIYRHNFNMSTTGFVEDAETISSKVIQQDKLNKAGVSSGSFRKHCYLGLLLQSCIIYYLMIVYL